MTTLTMEQIQKQFDAFRAAKDETDPKERKRLHIVQSASALFVSQGYRKTNVEQVAREAGVAKGTVYLYFKNKAEILLHAIVEEKRQALSTFSTLFTAEPEHRLRAWLDHLFLMTTRFPLITKVLTGDKEIIAVLMEIGADRGEDWGAMQQGFVASLISEVPGANHLSQSQIQDRAKVLLGLVYFAAQLKDPEVLNGLTTEKFGEVLADMLMGGIGFCPP